MRVFITDLAAYNQAYLIGRWVELPMTNTELQGTIQEIFKNGEEVCKDGDIHQEYFLTDWEDTDLFQVGESTNMDELNKEVARFNELNLDDSQKKCVSFLMSENIVSNLDEAIEKCEDVILYADMTFLDLAYEIVDEQYNLDELPQFVSNYFDYVRFASDLELDQYTKMDGDIFYYPY